MTYTREQLIADLRTRFNQRAADFVIELLDRYDQAQRQARSAGTTHWEGCWRQHFDCAVARIEEMETVRRQTREQVLREAIEVVNFSEGDCDFVEFKLQQALATQGEQDSQESKDAGSSK